MQVVLHAGAHMTDEDRLVKCLISNRETLAEIGTDVPIPKSYRRPIRDLVQAAIRSGPDMTARDALLHDILTETAPERLVLSHPSFFGTPKMAAAGGILYTTAETRLHFLRQIFAEDQVELFLAIRNPATFLPALFEKTNFNSFDDFLQGADPMSVRWSDMLLRVRADHPDMPITVWCNEDTPLLWSQILREMGGMDPITPLNEEFSLLSEIMTAPGLQRFHAYLASHPGMTEIQKRRVIAAFLDKFADDTAIEQELDIPGWTDALIDQITDAYDEDVFAIQRIPGVNMITP